MELKFKYAEPETVTGLMTDALREFVPNGCDQEVSDMVRAVSLALFQAGCVVIQLDTETTTGATVMARGMSSIHRPARGRSCSITGRPGNPPVDYVKLCSSCHSVTPFSLT